MKCKLKEKLCVVEFPSWLKSLRLHKYSDLFSQVSYEDMLQIDGAWLSQRVSICLLDCIRLGWIIRVKITAHYTQQKTIQIMAYPTEVLLGQSL